MSSIAPPAKENIETIARLEHEFQQQRTPTERAVDAVAGFAGSLSFVLLHLGWFAGWLLLNTGRIRAIEPFDPYPFALLSVIVSCEAVLLSSFVLTKQNRMSRRADQRDHLHLQIGILAEKEVTELLRLQQLICAKLEISTDQTKVAELAQNTQVESLARELEEKIPT